MIYMTRKAALAAQVEQGFVPCDGAIDKIAAKKFVNNLDVLCVKHDLADGEELAPVEAPQLTDDELFAALMSQGRNNSKVTPRDTGPKPKGYYAGERRPYPKKEGVTKAKYDLLTKLWQEVDESDDFALSASERAAICEVNGWLLGSFNCDYRMWRLWAGLTPTTRAPKEVTPVPKEVKAPKVVKTKAKRAEVIAEPTAIDAVEIYEV